MTGGGKRADTIPLQSSLPKLPRTEETVLEGEVLEREGEPIHAKGSIPALTGIEATIGADSAAARPSARQIGYWTECSVSYGSALARTPSAPNARCSLPHSGQGRRAMLRRVASAVLPSTRMPLS
jgi:hypothetical protein